MLSLSTLFRYPHYKSDHETFALIRPKNESNPGLTTKTKKKVVLAKDKENKRKRNDLLEPASPSWAILANMLLSGPVIITAKLDKIGNTPTRGLRN